MFIIENYGLAIAFCVITMICWGSWANTQKLVQHKYRFELFYWDYVIGINILALATAFTLGSHGEYGRSFLVDFEQADWAYIQSAFFGGVVFNLANILLTAAIAGAGMAIAFPIGIGIALIMGVVINYILVNKGDTTLLFLGVFLVLLAIVVNSIAYKKQAKDSAQGQGTGKWILISIIAGILMSTFYSFVAAGMDFENFIHPKPLKMTPYTAFVVFSTGILVSNFLFNTILMRKPLSGEPISYKQYFSAPLPIHLVGVLGGCIWGIGNIFNLIASGQAGPAVSYGLGQGATLVAAFWGVFVWKEFKGANPTVKRLVALMFLLFIVGIILVILAGQS